MSDVRLDVGRCKLTYIEYAKWCDKVGLQSKYDPKFIFEKGDWILICITIPEEFAVIFRLEYGI